MHEAVELSAPVIPALALAGLWALEALVPMFHHGRGETAHRMRNLALGVLNAVVSSTALAAVTLLVVEACRRSGVGLLWNTDWPVWAEWAVALLAMDLAHYAFHWCAHNVRWIWRFHAIHHHDDKLNVTSAMRFHLAEVGVQCGAMLLLYAALGASMAQVLVYHLILSPVAMFHHANVRLPERVDLVLRWFIVTPRMHWMHHSRWQPETDSNYSSVLSVWDRLFGSYTPPRAPEEIEFGLDGYEREDIDTLRGLIVGPFGPVKSLPGEPPPSVIAGPRRRPAEAPRRPASAPEPARAPAARAP